MLNPRRNPLPGELSPRQSQVHITQLIGLDTPQFSLKRKSREHTLTYNVIFLCFTRHHVTLIYARIQLETLLKQKLVICTFSSFCCRIMVISKGFSLITNAILDENKLHTLDDIKMAKKPKKRSISEPGPGKEDDGSKDSLSRSDDDDFLEKDEKIKGYGFVKVGIDIPYKLKVLK